MRKENLYILVWIDKIRKWQKKCQIKRWNLSVVLFVYDNVREFLTHFNSKALARLENFGVSAG